ncbi:MAG: VanZ family protein [Candidatus Electrothrix sp. MAN1_4]|nr:VanZ family protein [Candidatus Electrothrix sp. MAN1_4]
MKFLLIFIRKYWRGCTITLLIMLTVLSLWPMKSLPSVPGGDKFHHIIAYAALAFPIALRHPKLWYIYIFLFIAYSGVLELVQPFVNRYGEWLDMAANTSGVVCGILLAKMAHQWEKRQARKQSKV